MWNDYSQTRRRQIVRKRFPFLPHLPEDPTERAKLIAKIAKISFIVVIVGILGVLISFPLIARELPSPTKVVKESGFSTKITDRNGKVLYDVYQNENNIPIDFSDMPQYLREGVISIEDKNFYKNNGFDLIGIARGLFNTVFRGQLAGGSTLTQQLVKNSLLTQDRTVVRKFKEVILTIEVNANFSKDQILQMYLNQIPYGGTALGIEAASEMYFGIPAKNLNLVECAFLAGLPQSPTYYSPYTGSVAAYTARTQDVLRQMQANGYITSDQEKEADNQIASLPFQNPGASFKAPHFVQYVEKEIEDKYGAGALQGGGLTVTTTLDLDLQDKVQQIVTDEIAKVESDHITNGAAVVLNPQTGEILAMVGSKDFNAKDYDGQYNVAVALRQPGSSIKPFTYVTAFKKGYTPATMVMDVQTSFPGGANNPDYVPVNYDGKFVGPIQLRYALANSRNVPAVKVLAMVGIKDMLQTAYDAGIPELAPTQDNLNRLGLSVTLGGGEVTLLDLADGYSIFMNGGYRVNPISILKITDAKGNILEQNNPQKGNSVITAEQAFLIDDILSDNVARTPEFGANSSLLVPGLDVAVKTGTTNDKRDNWTVGGNSEALAGVWVGNNDNSPMLSVASGITGAAPIWNQIIQQALAGKPKVTFNPPPNIVKEDVDTVSGYQAHDGFQSRSEYFIKGTQPQGPDPVHVNLKVCKEDGKLATPSNIAANDYNNQEYFVFKEEDPTAAPGGENKWQEGILNWLNTQNDNRYHPPTTYCGSGNPVNVDFSSPHDQDGMLGNNFTISVNAQSSSTITEVDFYIDGTQVGTVNNLPYQYQANGISNGIHTLRAVAKDQNGNQSDRTISVGVGQSWSQPTPSPSPTPVPTP
ncbi:MAG TPA: transglycosylase domain-containing protein [Patescibacteria group bacterium]|nr:transglycosylase domain-containing protein [Patescibacteria group bacterium]